jgi:hypothetical protein
MLKSAVVESEHFGSCGSSSYTNSELNKTDHQGHTSKSGQERCVNRREMFSMSAFVSLRGKTLLIANNEVLTLRSI